MKAAVLALCFLAYVNAHRRYQHIIPNGDSVPDPCRHNHVWDAVGHFNPSTGSSHNLNPFGQDFRNAGYKWTAALCHSDSDGDGKSNGEELGDPRCTWTGTGSPSGHATSHPGICDPIDSAHCAHARYNCGCHGRNCIIGK